MVIRTVARSWVRELQSKNLAYFQELSNFCVFKSLDPLPLQIEPYSLLMFFFVANFISNIKIIIRTLLSSR